MPSPGVRVKENVSVHSVSPPDCGLGRLGVRGADEGTQDLVEQARRRPRILQAVRLGLLGEVGLDLAHLGQAEQSARPRGVDRVLGGQHDRDEDRGRRCRGDGGGAQELARGRQLVGVGLVGVVHGLVP